MGKRRMKRKLFKIILLLILLSTFTVKSFADAKKIKIVMVLWRGMTDSEKGFLDGLEKLEHEVDYDIFNAKQDRSELAKYLRLELLPKIENYDYIYSFGTTATQMVKSLELKNTPHIFNIVTDPVKANIVNSLELPGGNISGVSHKVSLEEQIKMAMKIKKIKNLAFFFNPRESNSLIIKTEMEYLSNKYAFNLLEYRTPPINNVLEDNLSDLKTKGKIIDFVYIPLDSYLTSKSTQIADYLKELKVASLAAIKEHVDNGALLGLVPDYYLLGKKAARVLDRHYNGENLAEIEVQREDNPKLAINNKTKKEITIEIPTSLLRKAIKIDV